MTEILTLEKILQVHKTRSQLLLYLISVTTTEGDLDGPDLSLYRAQKAHLCSAGGFRLRAHVAGFVL